MLERIPPIMEFTCIHAEVFEMASNVFYSAYSYLDEWMRQDFSFHRILSFERRDKASGTTGAECLVKVANSYKVIRTLRKTGESPRLKAAYEALQATGPLENGNVVSVVDTFATALCEIYGTFALSAASKFLWMRFRSPVIIYDSIVSKWLSKNCNDYLDEDYSSYHRIWSRKYQQYEEQIREACAELKSIKKFTHACEVSEDQLSEWTTSPWFMERVFDHYMLNDFPSE
jgi:hypothetical protein